MTTDPRLRTLVSEGREAAEGVRDRAAVVVEAVVAPRHELPLVEAAGEELQVGELVAGRFQIQVLAQVGGMGSIYRAEDLLDGKLVAVKTLRRGVASLERFEREASRLASLHHPGIPAYVASGFTSSGLAYLAMEWLDGIDLAAYTRLRRIGVQTAVELVRRVAEAVASAHKMGLVHRDLNPGNLFLVNQNPENVRVLDFGIARLTSDSQPVTERGAKLGTPGYMAPEQVEGQDVTPETDVFALGCVLYELLTGQRAFAAPTVAEVLARIVRDTPERPSAFNAGIPPELDEVVLACIDKDPRQRPEDAEELASLLGSFQGLVDASISNQGSAPASRGSGEQQISAMIVLSDDPPGTFQRASQAAAPHGLRAQRGLDGTIVLVASGPGTATDHATRAARCALAVQKATRSPRMAVTTGLAQIDGPSPSGRAFDAALVSLLVRADEDSARGSTIWLDENTATLLDSRFDVRRVDRGFVLTSLRETYEPARTVLGRKTRCVGRKRELSMLEATLTECVEEGMASAVLITGPPGIGKSRLAYEVSRKARRWPRPVEILRGGADPMSAGSPFSMLIEVVQRACQIRESEAEPARKQKLLRRLERVMPADELPRVAEFLGELIGTRVQDQDSAQLAAARRDSVLRGDQILRAFEDWLRAECGQQAVLLVLDDFHWGDLPTVKFIDSVLRNLSEQPLMVMALARPEVHDYFPKLWSQRSVTELRVSGLSRRAVTEMIQEVLGDQVDPAIVERVAGRAQGNPYWIEELLRAEDSGQGEDVPDRVLLLAQSRIAQLPVDARRILRAGSVFGRRFWLTGARALLGPDSLGRSIDAVMRDLLEAEFLVERDVSRVGGEREFEFASGLLRDAAYSLLPEDEREAAHGLAAVWLERSGLSEPLPIALHYTLGGEAERARPHYLRAAEHSLAGNDLEGALSSAREGLAAGASGRDAVSLRLVQAEANRWRGDNQAALRFARQAFDQATDPTDFYRAGAEAAVASGKLGDMAACREISERLLGATTAPDAQTERSIALCRAATQVILAGQNELARRLVADAEQSGNRLHPDPRRLGFLLEARALLAGADADPIGRIAMAEQAAEAFDDAGDLRNACLLRISLGYAQVEFGANQEAQASLRDALRVAERMDLANTIPIGQAQLGRALGRSGAWDEAIGLLHEAAGRFDRHKNVRLAGSVRTYLAEMHLRAGHPDLALEAARHAVPLLEPFPPLRRVAEAVLALVAMEATPEDGVLPVEDMKGLIERSFGDLASGAHLATGEDWVRLARLEWLVRSGDARAAEVAAEEGERLQGLAEGLSPTHRQSYLSGAPERRRLIARAERPGVPLGAMFAVESAVVPEPPMKKLSSLDLPTDLDQTLADLAAVEAEADPILRNLWITQRYHVLSGSLAEVIDRSNVNWSTFACWASKTAGQSIRSEEIPRMVEKELHLDRASLGEIQGVIGAVLEWLPLGGMVRRAATACLGDVSRQVADGNRKVYAELAPLFARFAALLQQDPGEAAIEQFVGRLRPGPPETGGQDALRRAFHAWYRVSRSDDPRQRAESMLYANCMVGLHEQTRLQPNIQGAMNAPLELLFRQRLTAQLPRFIGPPVAFVVSALLRPFRRKLTSIWQRVATRFAMNLTLPRGQEIPLGEDLPDRPNVFPLELRELRDSELVQLVQRYDHQLTTTLGSGANDWADLQDRMGFIVALFRSRQQDRDLFEPPFSAGQEVELAQGQVPSGVL